MASRRSGKLKATTTPAESLPSTGPTCGDGMTCEPSLRNQAGDRGSGRTSSVAAIHAKETATPEASGKPSTRTWEASSSALFAHLARALFFERIRGRHDQTLFGPGIECGIAWKDLATLCCPSDSDPVALGLTIDAIACGCSVKCPTPTASMWAVKDVPAMLRRRDRIHAERGNGGFGLTLAQWLAVRFFPTPTARDWKGWTGKGSRRGTMAEAAAVASQANGKTVYPHPEFVEAVMRFPISWTELDVSATPLTPSRPSGSAKESSKRSVS